MTDHEAETVDVLGVGFGPANLALAIALREHVCGPELRTVFLEAQREQSWHGGMLLEDASMQISFLKDLVTFRNPNSRFSFVSFLHEKGRLADFTNRGAMEPLRIEFAAYLRWAAEAFGDVVRYGSRVERIVPVRSATGSIDEFEVLVASADGIRTLRTRTVVVAAGLQPRLPAGIEPGPRCWHSGDHLHRVGELRAPRTLAVVGTGQSAMEVALDLNARHPDAHVHLVSSQFGIGPSYQGPLVNGIFDPETVDLLYAADETVRARLDRLHRNANNGVASSDTIRDFFDRRYRDEWLGRERLVLHRVSRMTSLCESAEGVRIVVRSDLDGRESEIDADAVVFGTGYTALDMSRLLRDDTDIVRLDSEGRPVIGRDHVAELAVPGDARLVLVGQSDHLHGMSSPLLSTVAVRAGEIAETLLAAAPRPVPAPLKGRHAVV